MKQVYRLVIFVSLLVFVGILIGCSGSTNTGVANVNPSDGIETSLISRDAATYSRADLGNQNLTDEEVASAFASCLRDYGFDVSDPELNADGSLNMSNLKSSLDQDPKWNDKDWAAEVALRECLPIMEDITLPKEKSKEDEIEAQDKMLEYTQCIRDQGLYVSDPDFSNGTRGAAKSKLSELDTKSSKIQRIMSTCKELVYGTGNGSDDTK